MIFYIGDKKYDYSEKELDDLLISDEGQEGNVYRIGKRAVKIYRPYMLKYRLDERTTNLLKGMETKRILVPKESVYNSKKEFNGYTTNFINTRLNKNKIHKLMKMKKFIEEVKLFEEDVDRLTSENISIADLNINNIEVSDGIYFFDPGSFVEEEEGNRFLGCLNRDEVNMFFINEIMSNELTKKEKNNLKNHFSYSTSLSDMLECENIDSDETVHKFVKKIVNKR